MRRGRLITLEGGEGAGKTTQAARLAGWLRARGVPVTATREPGGTPAAEELRRLLLSNPSPGQERERGGAFEDPVFEALLHCAARRSHTQQLIEPTLARGEWVVCDRFADSTMAYQGYAMNLGREAAETLDRITLGPLRPDLTLILDIPAADGMTRARGAALFAAAKPAGKADRYERRTRSFHEAVCKAFLEIARREPERCVRIDAGENADAVAAQIARAVAAKFALDA